MTHQILDKIYWDNNRQALSSSFNRNEQWLEVIGRFEQRVRKYFLNPIETITILGNEEGEGFSIVSLQCIVIEMFASFKEGKIFFLERGGVRNPEPRIYYTKSSGCFVDFLQGEKEFNKSFSPAPGRNATALQFYENVRCGLLHEARTKSDWKINAKKDERYSDPTTTEFIKEEPGKVSLDRKILNNQLSAYFTRYLGELDEDNQKGNDLRKFLGRCLDNHYNHARDININWWKV